MNGIHDLGGHDGYGPVVQEPDEPVWHADWERAAFTMFFAGAVGGYFNLDMFRAGIEAMPPAQYLSTTYYEHWLHSIEGYVAAGGGLDPAELDRRTEHYLAQPDEPLPSADKPELAETFAGISASGLPAERDTGATPEYAVGDTVRVTLDAPLHHTRKAAYIRGHVGVIEAVHAPYVFPDSASRGKGEDPQVVYSVAFTAAELWGDAAAEPNTTVVFDVWEPYLEAV